MLNWVEGSNREGWYWRADSQRDTLVSVLNTDTQDARVAISLDYYQDSVAHSYDLPERTLPPGVTSLLDIGAIIASGIPDANGSYFPLGVNFGGYHVRKIGQHIDKTITTEALVFDRRSKTFTTFYNTCCGISGTPTFNPGLFFGPEGQLGNFLNRATDYCSGQTSWSDSKLYCTVSMTCLPVSLFQANRGQFREPLRDALRTMTQTGDQPPTA